MVRSPSASLNRRQFLHLLTAGVGATLCIGTGLYRWHRIGRWHAVTRSRVMLGTMISMTVHHQDLRGAHAALDAAFDAMAAVDRCMSIHRADSDLSRVNAAAGRLAVPVAPALCEVVMEAQRLTQLTDGAYDPTCLPLLRLYGFYRDGSSVRHLPTERHIAALLERIGAHHIVIDTTQQTIGLLRAGAAIDLGSIGKGYAVDRAAAALRRGGIAHALIDAGGNILAMGAPQLDGETEAGWRVGIRNPAGTAAAPYFSTITLRDEAVATSGNYEHAVWLDGRRIGHLFDATTGHPVERGVSATVVAASATLADGLSSSAFLLWSRAEAALGSCAKEILLYG
ncbi:MAG: FAD:protein FMN transferase [Deltaproteobacteria bacterium]|nr:FAD:protein FMN transferase [Deltaproteobacteria bacterium]